MYGTAVPSVSALHFRLVLGEIQFTKVREWEKISQFRGFVRFSIWIKYMYGTAVPSVSALHFRLVLGEIQFTKVREWEKISQFRGFVRFVSVQPSGSVRRSAASVRQGGLCQPTGERRRICKRCRIVRQSVRDLFEHGICYAGRV